MRQVIPVDKEHFERMRSALANASQSIRRFVAESGGCDHDVGICMCADIIVAERCDKLSKAKGA